MSDQQQLWDNYAACWSADPSKRLTALGAVAVDDVTYRDPGTEVGGLAELDAYMSGFAGAFPGESDDDDLEGLRELFLRKALVARQGRVCAALVDQGVTHERIERMRVCELPDGPEPRRCLELREQLGIPAGPDAAAFVAGDGAPVSAEHLGRWLRMARLIATSLEANGGICRSLLQFRHGLADDPEEVRR
jgi:hypothetical protein